MYSLTLYGRVSDSLPKVLILTFFFLPGTVFEHLTDHKDLNLLINFWINERAFVILFQNFNSISGYGYISLQSWSPK